MTALQNIDQANFRKILTRNITLPLALGVLTAIVFVGLIVNLISAMNWVEHTERVIGKANEITKLSVDLESGMRGYLLTGKESFLTPYQVGKPKLAAEISGLIELVSDNPVQVDRLKQIRALQLQWDNYAQGMIQLRAENQSFDQLLNTEHAKLEFDEMRKQLGDFLEMEQRLLKERNDSARSVTTTSVVLFLLFSLAASAFIAYSGRQQLMHLSNNYGEILQKQTEHADFLQTQAWLRTGQAELAEEGLGQLAISELGKTALSHIAHYVGARIGAIYLREDDATLQRFATYGFDKASEDKEQKVLEVESLLGRVVLDNKLMLLNDLPETHIKVTTGLGDSAPKNIAIVPITNDGRVNGVIELGFTQDVSSLDTDYLTLISNNLGTALEVALSRQRLQNALSETQQLNEELQVQQEELRTANEELEEQSSILEESQSTLENQKAELEQTNDQLAAQASALDQKNESLKDAQKQLEERADELEKASQYKSEFLSNMSHELRTPLNSSLILSKLLSDNPAGNLTEEQVKFAQTIYSSGNDLLNLINDILDISKVEAGKLDLYLEPVSLRKLSESLKSSFLPVAENRSLTFKVKIASDVPDSITTDRQRIEQILKNLLSNALKFTDKGSVTLSFTKASLGGLNIAVKDTGIGVSTENQQSIFEAFHQADGTISRRYGGTGLGLSISRDLAKLLNGSISLQSTPGQGSTFTLTVPFNHAPEGSPESIPTVVASFQVVASVPVESEAPAWNGERVLDDRNDEHISARLVLVVEDEPVFAKILYDLAHEMQYRCLIAHTASEALQLARQYTLSAILLDIELPDTSGLSVLQQLKENPKTRHIPVHAVSGSDHSTAALHLGAIGYAIKPKTRDELKEVFKKLEDKFTQKIKRVLLVEDDAVQRESLVQLISDNDVEITAVEFGEEALSQLRTTIFDCMIIDLKLPDMKGNELLKRMSSEGILSSPPVIIYTGRNLTRDEEIELMKYSRSIIIKGARSPERLLDEVTLFLHKVESQMSNEQQSMLKIVRSRDRIFEGRKILLVDDDVRNIFALTKALEQKGVQVAIARNGFEAISQLDQVPDIDLVLMDIMMPEMDGLEATRRIRQDARFQRLPIIAITAKAMKDDHEQCLNAGTNDYLAKPIDLSRLQSLLRVWMPNMERM